ncbi:hypothetical protein [Lentzea sp. NPDC092896]|uniref:hypothetical protein n=1 Tax=Lentzea sp. NPDC092896 TaxID=3364127 RepID=UPI00382B92F7
MGCLSDADEHVLDHLYLLVYGKGFLGFCACNDPQAGIEVAHAILQIYAKKDWKHAEIEAAIGGTAGTHHLVMSALDRAGFADHGSSLWAAWPTPIGAWFLWAVDHLGIDGLDDRLGLPNNVGFPDHDDADCTDACWAIPAGSAKR